MQHSVQDNYPPAPKAGFIKIHTQLFELFQRMDKPQMTAFFQNLRLDLQSRISSLGDRDLVKLQGKIEYVDELEKLFLGLLK